MGLVSLMAGVLGHPPCLWGGSLAGSPKSFWLVDWRTLGSNFFAGLPFALVVRRFPESDWVSFLLLRW